VAAPNEFEVRHAEAAEIFFDALKACDIASSFDRRIRFEGDVLHRLAADGTSSSTIDMNNFKQIFVVALGKAAGPMLDALLDRMKRRTGLGGIYCSNQPPKGEYSEIQFFEGGHPVPNEASFAAARAALTLLKTAQKDTLIFFLISGGGSAMFELPLDSQITLEETITFYQVLLGSGAPINEMNTLRKHFSAVKGGRLALAAREATKVNLLLPDVPLQSLDALSSGPTFPNRSTLVEVRELMDRYALVPKLPESVRRFFDRRDPVAGLSQNEGFLSCSLSNEGEELTRPPEPSPSLSDSDEVLRDSWFEILLSSHDLLENARAIAEKAGYYVVVDNTCDDWDYAEAARYLLDRFHALRGRYPRFCLISVGEVTVTLKERPGFGGRNQQFVLQCALELDRHQGQRLIVLSAGSDGIDGNTQAAGAIADVTTVARAHALGYDAEASLAAFDASPLFAALGDLVVTKSTGQNLRDLRLLIGEF
jgi:glycerate 2-kinase